MCQPPRLFTSLLPHPKAYSYILQNAIGTPLRPSRCVHHSELSPTGRQYHLPHLAAAARSNEHILINEHPPRYQQRRLSRNICPCSISLTRFIHRGRQHSTRRRSFQEWSQMSAATSSVSTAHCPLPGAQLQARSSAQTLCFQHEHLDTVIRGQPPRPPSSCSSNAVSCRVGLPSDACSVGAELLSRTSQPP